MYLYLHIEMDTILYVSVEALVVHAKRAKFTVNVRMIYMIDMYMCVCMHRCIAVYVYVSIYLCLYLDRVKHCRPRQAGKVHRVRVNP